MTVSTRSPLQPSSKGRIMLYSNIPDLSEPGRSTLGAYGTSRFLTRCRKYVAWLE